MINEWDALPASKEKQCHGPILDTNRNIGFLQSAYMKLMGADKRRCHEYDLP